jgi:hypothetical protein
LDKRRIERFSKYRPDQRRDDHGRFADEGKGGASGGKGRRTRISQQTINSWGPAIVGAAIAGAAGVGAAYLTRGRIGGLRNIVTRVAGGGAAARQARMAQARIRPATTTKPPTGGTKPPKPTAKPAAAGTTKPYNDLGRRQQQRREAAVRADAVARGATPKQADDLVARMRAAASQQTSRAEAQPAATITTPRAVSVTRTRIEAERRRHAAALREYNDLAAKGTNLSDAEFKRRTYLFNEMNALEQSIADRERALGRVPGSLPALRGRSKKRAAKAMQIPTESEAAASAVASQRAGSAATDAYTLNTTHQQIHGPDKKPKKPPIPEEPEPTPEPPKTGFGSITFKFDGGRYNGASRTVLKYREDQRRDDQGQFADEGKGGVDGGTAAVAGGALAALALAHPAGRVLARHLRRGNVLARREAQRQARRRVTAQRLTQPTPEDMLNRRYDAAYGDRASSRAQSAMNRLSDKLPQGRDRKGTHTEFDVAAPDVKLRILELLGWI